MKRLLMVLAATVALLFTFAAPATATDADGYDHTTAPDTFDQVDQSGKAPTSVFATTSVSAYTAHDFAIPPGQQGHPKVRVRPYAKKQADGIGWVTTQINLDTWEAGLNPANSPCGGTTQSVKGDVRLTKLDASGNNAGVLRTWTVELCNGDGGNEILLGGDNAVTFNSNGFRVDYSYRVAIDQGHDFNGYTVVKKKSTGATSWAYGCGGTWNLDDCSEYQAG